MAPLEDDRAVQNIKPVISREGLRQAAKKSSAQSGGVRRRKKTAKQVEYLTTLYNRLGGKWDGKVRKEAMAATGLSRIQIYKWFFDRQLQEKTKKDPSETSSNNQDDESTDGVELSDSEQTATDSQQLFMVEKDATTR